MARTSSDMIVWFFIALFLLSLYLLGKLLWPFLAVLIIGSVVTWVFYPVYRFIGKKSRPAIASLATCVIIFFVLFIPMLYFFGLVTNEAREFVIYIKDANLANQAVVLLEKTKFLEKLNTFLVKFNITLTYGELVKPISDFSKFAGLNLLNLINTIGGQLINFFVNFFLMLVITFYLLMDGKRLIWFIVDLSPLPNDEDQIIVTKFKEMSGAILIGNGLSGLVQGIAGGLIFGFFGLPSPVIWGVIMGFLAFLPIVGIGIIFFPTMVIMFIKGHVGSAIILAILYVLITAGVEYLLKPVLVGKQVKMHTLVVFLSIIGGLYMSGILGIIYGPLIVTFFLTLTDMYNSKYRSIIYPSGEPPVDDINLI